MYVMLLLIAVSAAMSITSCVKEEEYLTGRIDDLAFSVDTLKFDTVFATMGSTTRSVKVYNRGSNTILLSAVTLRGGSASRYRINVDGDTSLVAKDVEIASGDSIFIFVRVNINPNSVAEPFLVEDAVVLSVAEKGKVELPLIAYGRNAVYHTPTNSITAGGVRYNYSVINCAQWDHTKPHIILGYAVVDEDSVLTLMPGAELYFAHDACLWVYDGGTLRAEGNLWNPITFTSVRHDGHYKNLPGQWQGIWLSAGSRDNTIKGAVIENAVIGLLVDTVVNSNPTLQISDTKVRNMTVAGIYGQGAHIEGENLLVTNCGTATVAFTLGGNYKIGNSTLANYWSYTSRRSPSIVMSNWYEDVYGNIQLRPLVRAEFNNCIIYGSMEEELLMDRNDMAAFDCQFNSCLVRTRADIAAMSANTIVNEDPLFASADDDDYRLRRKSPAREKADFNYVVLPHDLANNLRCAPTSMGAYDFHDYIEK